MQIQSGIPTATPSKLTPRLQSLPPILYKIRIYSILSYSKAPWGLSVQSRVTGIFTGTTISPGGLLRQCPDHYAFHAGQNLPDKEFRYLRTVIVTAAVHRGFNSKLSPLLLTFRHRAGFTPYTSSYDLAQSCVFGKQLLGPLHCGSFYGALLLANLRSNFAEFLNNSYLAHLRILSLTTCVRSRYGPIVLKLAAFLGNRYQLLPTQVTPFVLRCFTWCRILADSLSLSPHTSIRG